MTTLLSHNILTCIPMRIVVGIFSLSLMTWICAGAVHTNITSTDPIQNCSDSQDRDFDLVHRFINEQHRDDRFTQSRRQWPRDIPIRVAFDIPYGMLALRDNVSITVHDCEGELILRRIINHAHLHRHSVDDRRVWSDETVVVPLRCISENRAVIQYGMHRPNPINPRENLVNGSKLHEIDFVIELVDSIEEILDPSNDQRFTNVLKAQTNVRFMPPDRGDNRMRAALYLPRDWDHNIIVALNIEIIVDHKPIAHGKICCTTKCRERISFIAARRDGPVGTPIALDITENDFRKILQNAPHGAEIMARISGCAELALRDFTRSSYWNGEFMIEVDLGPYGPPLE